MESVAHALGLPVSVLFFPAEEIEKRKMISDMFMHTVSVLEQSGMLNTPMFSDVASSSTETTVEYSV